MTRFARPLWRAAVVAVLASVLATSAAWALPASEAGGLLGSWALSFEGPMGPVNLTVTLKDEGGNLAAKVEATDFAPSPVSEVAKTAEGISLKFTIDAQGMTLPAKLILSADGAKLKANFDIADGMLSIPGAGTKK